MSPMLNTKPQGHRPFGSTEDFLKGVLPYMGMVAIDMANKPVPPAQGGST